MLENVNFLSEFDWLQLAASSGGYLAFGTQLEQLIIMKTRLTLPDFYHLIFGFELLTH